MPVESISHLRVDMWWPHIQSRAVCLVGRGYDLEEKAVIREAREREAGREEGKTNNIHVLFSLIVDASLVILQYILLCLLFYSFREGGRKGDIND